MAKDLNARGIRRMLVTTLGRIDRLERAIQLYADTPDEVAALKCQLIDQNDKLRKYNAMAARYRGEYKLVD